MNKENVLQKSSSTMSLAMSSSSQNKKWIDTSSMRNQQYYLDKLKNQRQKIEILIVEFDKLNETLRVKDEQIIKLKQIKDKHEELKIVLEGQSKNCNDHKKQVYQLKEENQNLKEEIRKWKNDDQKQILKTEIKCLEQRIQFYEIRNESIQRANTQLKQERQELISTLSIKKQEYEKTTLLLKERINSNSSEYQQVIKKLNQQIGQHKESLQNKQSHISSLEDQIKVLMGNLRSDNLKYENELKQLSQTLDLQSQSYESKIENLEFQLHECQELNYKKEAVFQKLKVETQQKFSELEKVTVKLLESESKLKNLTEQVEKCRKLHSLEDVKSLQNKITELEAKNKEYEDYLYSLKRQNLQEERLRKELEIKRNQEVDKIEMIFGRFKAKGIDLGTKSNNSE